MRSFVDTSKPFIRLGLIGAKNTDRNALANAISHVMAFQKRAVFRPLEVEEEERVPGERSCFGWNSSYVQFATDRFNVILFDYTSDQQARHFLVGGYGDLHGLVLVLNEAEGVTAQTEGLITLAARLKLPIVAVFSIT